MLYHIQFTGDKGLIRVTDNPLSKEDAEERLSKYNDSRFVLVEVEKQMFAILYVHDGDQAIRFIIVSYIFGEENLTERLHSHPSKPDGITTGSESIISALNFIADWIEELMEQGYNKFIIKIGEQ